MRYSPPATSVLIVCAALGACDPDRGRAGHTADSLALAAQYERFARAYPPADTATILGMYEDSAAIVQGGREIQLGREAAARLFAFLPQAVQRGWTPSIRFQPVRREFQGNLAWSVSNYEVAFTNGSDTAGTSHGTALVLWRKDDSGTWRIAADAFASRNAPAGP